MIVPLATKKCGACKRVLPVTSFYRSNGTKSGLTCYCKACQREKAKPIKARFRASEVGRVAYRRQWLRRYGLTVEQYENMLAAQGNRCRCCPHIFDKTRSGRANVDHCHRTGKVRAILCGSCNAALGMAKENATILRALANFIDTHSPPEWARRSA